MAKLDPEARKKVENKIIKYFNALDKTGINTKYYKELFAKMSDNQFIEWMKKPFPIRFQMRTGTTNPTMTDIENSLKAINVPLTEKIYMPYLYRDKDGNPVASQECTVVYMHLKKVVQFITHKNKWASSISNRDIKTGRLVGADKGAITSDREFESMASWGLTNTMEEFANSRADDMEAKMAVFDVFYNQLAFFDSMISNKALSNKKILLNDNNGIVVVNDNDDRIPLNKLSSGEQNLIILYYKLVFSIRKNDLLLIDEPENSLHAAWLTKMLDDYLDMADRLQCQIIIATHSITFINGEWDMTYDLYENNN